jgi:hypothetical protein
MISAICALSLSSLGRAETPSTPDRGPIAYATLEDALKALHSKSGVTFRDEGGWIVAEDLEASTVWLITPPGHPAYPSIVRRKLVNGPSGAYMNTDVRCLASQETCDKFFASR